MANNYVQPAGTISYTNAGSAIQSGDPVIIGTTVGVALVDIGEGETGSVAIEGAFELAKANAKIDQGTAVNLTSAKNVTSAAAGANGVTGFGIAITDAAAGDATVVVKLTPGTGAAGS